MSTLHKNDTFMYGGELVSVYSEHREMWAELFLYK